MEDEGDNGGCELTPFVNDTNRRSGVLDVYVAMSYRHGRPVVAVVEVSHLEAVTLDRGVVSRVVVASSVSMVVVQVVGAAT